MKSRGESGRARAWAVAGLLTIGLGVLPLVAGATPVGAAPIGAGAEARISYAIEHGEKHPAQAVAALLGALGVEAADDAGRQAIAAAIDERVCNVKPHDALCEDASLGARLAEWKPVKKAAVTRARRAVGVPAKSPTTKKSRQAAITDKTPELKFPGQ